MHTDTEPLAQEIADVEPKIRRRLQNIAWAGAKWLGKELPKVLVLGASGSAAIIWAALGSHEAMVVMGTVAVAVAFVALSAYTLGLRKQLVDERAMRRWAFVAGKRVQQEVLERDIALDEATLALVGDPRDREAQRRLRAPGANDFRGALRYARARLAFAASADRPRPPRARARGDVAAPVAPDVAGVRRRLELRCRELTKLEAEVQTLAAPDAVDLAIAADEAERSYRQQRDAAHAADREARDRRRAGRQPTTPSPGMAFELALRATGARDVRHVRANPTPEQIAAGHSESDPGA